MPNKSTIIYNLIVCLYDQVSDQYKGIDDPDFRQYVMTETGMNPTQYAAVMGQ